MVIERVSGILIHLQRKQWTGATSEVEDRIVDAWLCRSRRCEAVAEEVVNVWISAIQSSPQRRCCYREKVSSNFFEEKCSEGD